MGSLRLVIGFFILLVTISGFAASEDVVFGSSFSNQLVLDSILAKIFGEGKALDRLNGDKLEVMNRSLVIHSEVVSENRTDLSMKKDIDYLIGSKSVGNWFIGGSGTATLNDLNMNIKIGASNLNVDLINRTVGEDKVPGLRITLDSPLFRWVQKGKVKIKKHVLFFSWTETKNFKGVFRGLKWTGIYKLKKVTKVINGKRLNVFVLDQEKSILNIGEREFSGSGIPKAKFLKEYGDRIENNFARVIGNSMSAGFSFSSGEGETETREILATRKILDTKVLNSNLSVSMSVDVHPTSDFLVNDCSKELEAPVVTNPISPNNLLSQHEEGVRSLRSSTPLSFYEQMIYLRGRAGDLCGSSTDGLGGTLTFAPIGKISVAGFENRNIVVKLKMKLVHTNPLLPNDKLESILTIERNAHLIFENNSSGRTSKLEFESTTNKVSGGSNPIYATAVKALLDRRPLHLAVPRPGAVAGFVPKLRQADLVAKDLIVEYTMHTPLAVAPIAVAAQKAVAPVAEVDEKDEIDPGASSDLQARWNAAVKTLALDDDEVDLGPAPAQAPAIEAGSNIRDQEFDEAVQDEDNNILEAISVK